MKRVALPAGGNRALRNLDLNLLLTFEALWLERTVTAAGRRLGLSQPATSAALARLREMVGDRLFVRGKRGLEPTERCVELAQPLTKLLVDLRSVLALRPFDPSTTTRQLRIGAVDAAIAVWIPRVIARFLSEAPHARLQVVAIDPARASDALDEGTIDLALSPFPSPSTTVRSRALYPVELVPTVRPGHPLLKTRGASLEAFPRVHVTFEGLRDSVRAQILLGSYLAVPPVLAQTDAWATLPSPYADSLAQRGVVAIVPMSPKKRSHKFTMQLLWADAQDASPASRWLRGLIADVTRPG